jgi:thiol:disulfide interchange protein DsbD
MRLPTKQLAQLAALLLFCIASNPAVAAQHGEITKSAVNYSTLHPGQKAWAAVVVEIGAQFHAQSHTPLDENFIKFEIKPDEDPSFKFGSPKYPPAKIEDYPALGKLSVYTGKIVVYLPIEVSATAKPGAIEIHGKIRFQACDDKVCFPPEQPKFTIKTEITPANTAATPNEPDLFKDVEFSTPTASASTIAAPTPSADTPTPPQQASTPFTASQVTWKFFIAFLVGVIFNVMPCVLPVLPIKVIGFYNAAQHSRAKSVSFAAVFSLGLIATFAAFGILIFVTKKFDWGGLFTHTWFQLAIVLMLLGLAATTVGLFTIRLPGAAYNVETRNDTYLGNFLFGIFTALLSTPCTFGLFVGLLAWAITLNAPIIGVVMLIMVGLGMASPYLLLSATPELARRFPRTGPWGELFKQMMGLLLVTVAVYFARPFLGRIVHGENFWWVPFSVIVASCIYLIVRSIQFAKSTLPIVVSSAIALVVVVGSLGAVLRLTARPYEWQPFTDTALDQARAQNHIVLVEFTADWCGNCQYVEAKVLHNSDIVKAVRDRDVIMLKADVTTGDAPARPLLEKLNPAGSIPLTVIYSPNSTAPTTLNGIYSTDDLQKALSQAAAKPPAVAVAR